MNARFMTTSKTLVCDISCQIDEELKEDSLCSLSLAGAMPRIIWMANPDGSINYYNRAWFEHTGFTREQMQGAGWTAALHPNDLQCYSRVSSEGIRTGSPYQVEYRLKWGSDHSYRWHLSRAFPIKDESGKVTKWIGTCTDIDVQKKRKAVSEERLRAAIDITADAICLLDYASMRFVDCNDTACRMFGYSRDELLALGPSDIGAGSQSDLEAVYEEIIDGKSEPAVESQLLRRNGSAFPVEVQRKAMRSGNDWIMVLVARDITERKEAESRLQKLAYYDQLTGLPNRRMFYESLNGAIVQAEKQHLTISVVLINLDRFKEVNDLLGFSAGDELVRQIGHRLINALRLRDLVGRLGGDDFGLILFNSEHSQGAEIVANKVLRLLHQPFDLDGHEVSMTLSMGVAVYPTDATDADTLIKNADSAMHAAKLAGGNAFRFHTAEMNADMLAKRALQDALNKALINEEFVLHYQPKIQIDTGKWKSVEALLRWNRPGHGLVSPAFFIPALEETGLIMPIGEWVIRTACRQLREWDQSGMEPIKIAINVSAEQFLDENLTSYFASAIKENGIDSTFLEIEITESSLMADAKKTVEVLQELKMLGVRISIDDFGTGYSSLAYLRKFPIDKLKIDIAFIRDVTTNASDAAITTAIINMAHSLNMKVIAEGVETREQLEFLRARKCDEFQGYYFSKPLPAVELEKLQKKALLELSQ